MPRLILIPTELERRSLEPMLADAAAQHGWQIETLGFGPIAAAARSSQLIAQERPDVVCLIGIAGAFDGRGVAVGQATQFDHVACHGIGVGTGNDFRSAADLGWDMIQPSPTQDGKITDVISLCDKAPDDTPNDAQKGPASKMVSSKMVSSETTCPRGLLTCCAASANDDEALARAKQYPNVIAEDMEGFGVAIGCQLAGVPLRIVRGISNRVGDRQHDNWQIQVALQAAADLAINEVLRRDTMPEIDR